MRGATKFAMNIPPRMADFNPRAPCGARPRLVNFLEISLNISIHAPHAGRDLCNRRRGAGSYISIHAPHAGRDPASGAGFSSPALFQSTRPMRGATRLSFSHRPPRLISIHAPHAGRDTLHRSGAANVHQFQSTRPMRGATAWRRGCSGSPAYFNPRAPCGARRLCGCPRTPGSSDFNPRAPCGARRPCRPSGRQTWRNFNPRAPCGARPTSLPPITRYSAISIHAPHAGRDFPPPAQISGQQGFQSTRPMRGATV